MNIKVTSESLKAVINSVDEKIVGIMQAQKDAGMKNEFKSERSVLILSKLAGMVVEQLIRVQPADGQERELSKVVSMVMANGLPNYVAQTSTMQKKAVKAGVYAAPEGSKEASVEQATTDLLAELDKS